MNLGAGTLHLRGTCKLINWWRVFARGNDIPWRCVEGLHQGNVLSTIQTRDYHDYHVSRHWGRQRLSGLDRVAVTMLIAGSLALNAPFVQGRFPMH